MSVKDNQPSLHKVFTEHFSMEKLSGFANDSFEQEEVGQRGRKILRSYIVVSFSDKYGDISSKWRNLKSLCVAMTYKNKNGESLGGVGIRYFISSKEMKAEEFGKLCRGHWGFESMHWWLDAIMNEDASRIIYKHESENLSRIRQMCMNFIKLVEMKGTLKRRQLKCA